MEDYELNRYSDWQDAQVKYRNAPMVMTLAKAQALIDADADGIGMAETLIEKAYFLAYEEILKELRGVTRWTEIASVIIRLNIPVKSQVDGTILIINYLSRGCKCPHCHKPIARVLFHTKSNLYVGHTAPFVHERCYIMHDGTKVQRREYYAKQVLEGKIRKGRKS